MKILLRFSGPASYTFEGASERLADYQLKSNIVSDGSNNPDFIPEQSTFSSIGGSLQIGAAFLHFANYKYKDASILNHTNFTVGANIPIGRIIKAVRAKKYLNSLD